MHALEVGEGQYAHLFVSTGRGAGRALSIGVGSACCCCCCGGGAEDRLGDDKVVGSGGGGVADDDGGGGDGGAAGGAKKARVRRGRRWRCTTCGCISRSSSLAGGLGPEVQVEGRRRGGWDPLARVI